MNKQLKKVLSYALITSMVASMALTGFGGGARTVKAADVSVTGTLDSASVINFSTILGRAVDFGILASTLDQTGSHSETNMAVKKYIGSDKNNDPDLAGNEALPYIIGEISGKLEIKDSANDQNMTLNIETTSDIIANTIIASEKQTLTDEQKAKGYLLFVDSDAATPHQEVTPNVEYQYGKFRTVFKASSKADINSNINQMIKHITDESETLALKPQNVQIDQSDNTSNFVLDLNDSKLENKVVYIDVDRNGAIYRSLSSGELTIKKKDSTVIVFNIKGTDPVVLKTFKVNNVETTTNNAAVDGTASANHNAEVDSAVCQKIVWNITQATDIELYAVAGAFLVQNSASTTKLKGSSAGWIASAGTVENTNAEFHYIYRGRSKTLSSNENGAMHFAMHKSIYSTVDNSGAPVERDDISVSYKEFKFKIYETNSNFDITGAPFLKFGSEDKPFGNEANPTTYSTHNDANSKILFPDIKVSLADFTGDTTSITKYYVIKETNGVGIDPSTGIANNDGKVCIKLVANKVNENGQDVIKFNVTSKYYLTANDNTPWKTNGVKDDSTEPGIDMTGNEFSLGGFYNQYKEGGNLEITKEVTGTDEAYAPSTDTFELTLTATLSDRNTPLVGTFDAENLLSGTSVTFNSSGVATLNVADNSDITIKGLPDGAIVTVAETNKEHYNLQNQSTELEKTIAEGTTETVALQNEYTAPRGSLTITKTYAGITDSQIPHPTETLFQVTDKNGVTIAMIDWSQGTGSGLTRTFTVDNLPIGTYHVKEIRQNQTISGYSLEVGAKVNDTTQSLGADYGVDATVVESPATTQVDFTNTYVKNGSITVTKIVDGLQGTASLPSNYVIEYFDGTTKMGELTTNVDCSGAGTTSSPFTWTVDDVPAGKTVTFVESNYAVTGYDLAITTTPAAVANEDNKVVSAAVPEGGNTTVAFTNTYTRQKTNATLEKQWVINTGGSVADEITVKLLANGTQFGNDIVLHKDGTTNGSGILTVSSDKKTWTYAVNDLNKYDDAGQLISYTWEEVIPTNANYELSNVPVADSNNVTTFINTTPVQGKVTVNIIKAENITGDSTPFANKEYYVTITDADGNFYNANGAIAAVNTTIKINKTSNTSVSLPTGKTYTITEVNASQSNYTWTKKYTIGSNDVAPESPCEIDVTDSSYNNTTYPEITVTNTYVECGSVVIKKVADTSGDSFPTNAPTFPINVTFNKTGEYTVAQYPVGGTPPHAATVNFTENVPVQYDLAAGDKIEIFGVPDGTTYTITEGDISGTNYVGFSKEGVTGDVDTDGKGTIVSGTPQTVDVVNKYTEPKADLVVKKILAGNNISVPTEAASKEFEFTITGPEYPNGQTFTITGGGEHKFESIKLGEYTIVETVNSTHIDNYDCTISYQGASVIVGASNTGSSPASFSVTNTYAPQQSGSPTDLSVNIDKVDENGSPLSGATLHIEDTATNATVGGSWTSDGTTHTVSLPEGSYVLIEDTPPSTDYQVAAAIPFKVVKVTVNNVDTLQLQNAGGSEITSVVMVDKKVLKHDVKISKVDITNSREIVGAHLILYKDNGGGSYSQLYEWDSEINVRSFPLEAGDYAIKETVAPAGYEPAITLVKFNLSFDNQGKAIIVITDNDHNGTYDAAADVIKFEDDPIKVTGKLSVHVEEKKTGRPVPDAEVEVTGPDGTTKTYKTNGNGEIVDVNGNTPIDVPAGKYKVTVKKVPAGYEVETGQTAEVEVPENKEGRHIAKIVSSTGGLKIKVLEEGTNREVPDATVVVEAPEGVKFPDGSTKITAVTDKNGNITTNTGADGKTYDLTSGLTPGDYKITVTKVPAGYQVTTGETKTKKVVKDEVAEHVALIATSSSVKPAPAPAPAPAATPAATPATPTGSITNSINVKTGDDMNVYPALIAMALSLITGVSVVAFRRKRETK